MEKFYIDKERNEVAASYIGKTMGEIMELEEKRFEKNKPEIDTKHAEYVITRIENNKKEIKYMNTKKTAYYQTYDPSVLEMPEYCVREDMCDDIAGLENDIFEFGQEMIKLSKQLDGMENKKIASKIKSIVKKYCECYISDNDNIKNLDEYDGLELYDEDEDYDDSEEEE